MLPMAITMVLQDDRGVEERVTLSGPGGTLRVAVGEPGFRATVWRIWANRATSDVYVSVRGDNTQKFSLHASGDWRQQFQNVEVARQHTPEAQSRIIDQWQRPEESVAGWTKALSIWTGRADILPVPSDDSNKLKEVTWLVVPDSGHGAAIHVVVAKPDREMITLEAARPLAAFSLANGEVVLVLTSYPALQPDEATRVEGYRRQVLEQVVSRGDTIEGEALRLILHGYAEDGERRLLDLALNAQPEG